MMPFWLDGAAFLAAADADGTAVTAVGVCWTVPGWAPGRVETVTGSVVVGLVSARAWPEEKTTRPNRATAPTSAAGAARRFVNGRRRVGRHHLSRNRQQ